MDTPSIFDKCSFFILDKALFGCFPTQDDVNILESTGVRVFVNLTSPTEKKINTYKTNYTYMSYPIADKNIPSDICNFYSFVKLVYEAIKNLRKDEKIYVHCKGGHGRSGVVVACLLILYYNISADEAINHTHSCHQRRKTMRDIWRKIGSPQTQEQKTFVHSFEAVYKTIS
jgi:protein-tyrosine phosphatase